MNSPSEGSLNERTEDEGLGNSMNPLDDEPTTEQLIATGELDPGENEKDLGSKEPSNKAKEKPSSALVLQEEVRLGIRKEVERRLLAGESREQLEADGFNKNTVRTIASEIKSRLHTKKAIGRSPTPSGGGITIFAKGSPPEAIIEGVEFPDLSNGQGIPFEQGMKFGLSMAVLGVRIAQELSGIGVTQAKPLLDMAKSMREGEALAAKNAAGEAAMEAAGMVSQQMMPILSGLTKGSEHDPMRAMMARVMEPMLQNLMGQVVGRALPGADAPKQLPGWTRRTE